MTAFFKGKAVSQVDEILIDGKSYTEDEIKEVVKKITLNKRK